MKLAIIPRFLDKQPISLSNAILHQLGKREKPKQEMQMAQEWSIQSRGNVCHACQRAFNDKEECISALFPDPPGFLRMDFCLSCWADKEHTEPQPFSYWKTIFRLPPEAPPEPLRKETAESLLRRILEEDDPQQIPVMYILALMLERKKILVEKDVTIDTDETVRRIYEHRKTGEVFVVTDPRLQLDSLESVQQQVADMLGNNTVPEDKDGKDLTCEPQQERTEDAI